MIAPRLWGMVATETVDASRSIAEAFTIAAERLDINELADLGGATYVSGGLPAIFDGVNVHEAAFLERPALLNVVPSTPGGGIAEGAHVYVACYAWPDGAGRIMRSAPSDPVLVST